MRTLQLIPRAVLDCAYLVRTPHRWAIKIRLLLEYIRLTIKLILFARIRESHQERVMSYDVRHFGRASIQFLFREVFIRSDYLFHSACERPVIFDCGANIGMATLFFKWLYPRAEVHAFEPDPLVFQILTENVERNRLTDVHLHNVALCDRNGAVDLFVPLGTEGSTMMSLIAGRVTETTARRVQVNGRTLSAFIERGGVDFLKLDVEGGEDLVLRELSASGVLPEVREMAIEYHHNIPGRSGGLGGFLQLLHDSGYHYQVDATWRGAGGAPEFQDIMIRATRETDCRSSRSADEMTGTKAVA